MGHGRSTWHQITHNYPGFSVSIVAEYGRDELISAHPDLMQDGGGIYLFANALEGSSPS
jgi:hypothetical protein